MKTLLILAVILAVFAAYFVFNTEKSVSLKNGSNAVPAGIDIAKLILNKALNQLVDLNQSQSLKPKINNILQSLSTGEIMSRIGDIKDKILNEAVDLIKKPIESKISETFCHQK